jgi:hypothetical protein
MRMESRLSLFFFFAVATLAACGGSTLEPAPGGQPPGDVPPGGNPNRPPATCDAQAASNVAVSPIGLDGEGYPPYAVAQCSLVYVSTNRDLILRDLATGTETTIAPVDEAPEAPAVSIDPASGAPVIAWQATINGQALVRLRFEGKTRTISGAFDNAIEPRVNGRRVVFTAYKGPKEAKLDVDMDVWVHDAADGSTRVVFGGKAQQRFADINAKYIVATDFIEDPYGYYEPYRGSDKPENIADIVVYEIANGQVTTRKREKKQAFPVLGNDDVLAYLDWVLVHPQPKLEMYDLRGGRIGDPASDRTIARVEYHSAAVRPGMAGDTLEWIANPDGIGTTELWRAKVTSDAPAQKVAGLENLNLFAPAPTLLGTKAFTVLAVTKPASDNEPLLRVVDR